MSGLSFDHRTLPSRVSFGAGEARRRIDAALQQLGAERVLLVAGERNKALARELTSDATQRIAGHFADVRQHVPLAVAEAATATARRLQADAVLSIGGGSTTGTAKIIARDTGLPVVAVPTTYAGSEMTPVWGLTVDGVKSTGRDERVLPRVVVYDPELVAGLPAPIAVTSAFNALAHCVEASWSVHPDPVSLAIALEGVRFLSLGLRSLVAGDVTAPEMLLIGSMFGGMAFAATGSGLHHKICHALGGALDLPHAPTHTVVLPQVAAFTEQGAPEEARRIAGAMGGNSVSEGLADLAQATGAPRTLREIGLDRADVPHAIAVVRSQMPIVNIRPVSDENLAAIIRACSGW